MIKFTKDHEWILWEDSEEATVGITEHAVEELGDITYVELPEVGKGVKKGEAAGFVESVKAASDIYAPVSGEVSEVNDLLEGEPETLNKDPMGKGWIYKIKPSDMSEFDELMDEESYMKFIDEV